MSKKKIYNEITIARGIAVLLVLLGHSFPDAQTGITNPINRYLVLWIYSFHMPLFFLLSGFVFENKYKTMNTMGDRWVQIKSKCLRLLIPYLSYSAITLLLKVVFAAYAKNAFDFKDAWKIAFGITPNGGLWFLWTLFFISVIYIILNKVDIKIFIGISILLFLIQNSFLVEYGGNILKYSIYFAIGIWMKKYYESILAYMSKHFYLIPLLLTTLCILNYFSFKNGLILLLKAFLGIFFTLAISIQIMKKDGMIYKFLSMVAFYGMDIYLLSYFAQVSIRVIAYQLLALPYYLCMVSMFLLGGIGAVLASKCIFRKMKFLRVLFLGMHG